MKGCSIPVLARELKLAALLALAAAPATAATLIVGANGYTIAVDGVSVEKLSGLLIDDGGRILSVLRAGAKEPKLERGDYRLDLGGRTILPGLIDAHGHVSGLGEVALSVDLSGTKSLEDALDRVRAYAAANPRRAWITGRGWNQVEWGAGFPTAADLDRAVADRPVFLARIDGHAGWANGAAIKLAGVSARTKDPAGGRIERDAAGQPTGVFIDAAETLIAKHIPAATPEEREAAVVKALGLMAGLGLTGVHDAGVSADTWRIYRALGDEGRLTIRVTAMAAGIEAMDAIAPTRPTPFLYEDRLVLRTVKLYADGALGSRGAWLLAPYADAPGQTGLRFHSEAALKNMMSKANFLGFQLAVHAIGDAANAEVLAALTEMRATYGDLRNRVEHAQVVAPSDLGAFARAGIVASVQPTHATSDKAMAADRVGEARLEGAYAWATLARSGARLALGSDFPVEPANPFFGLHAAVTRTDRTGEPAGGWRAGEALTLAQALAGFTVGAAFAGHAETKVGRLAPGLWADFIVVDRDPFAVPPADLWRVEVRETWLAGRRVFARTAAAPVAAAR